jgi:hypothetical protein
MNRKLPNTLWLAFWLAVNTGIATAQVPPSLRLDIPFDAAWNGMRLTILEEDLKIIEEDRGRGFILTSYKQYISGPLTEDHIVKIGQMPAVGAADWVKLEYQYETRIELIAAKETHVTVNANLRAMKRDFFGSEAWVPVTSNGQRERDLMTKFGKLLFGQDFELEGSKPGLIEKGPSYVPDMSTKIPKVAGAPPDGS